MIPELDDTFEAAPFPRWMRVAGWMLLAVFALSFAGMLFAADKFVIDATLPAQNFTPRKADTGKLDLIQSQSTPVVEVWGPEWCKGPCEAMRKRLGDGNDSVSVKYVKSEAWFPVEEKPDLTYPILYRRDTGKMWYQPLERANVYEGPKNLAELCQVFDIKPKMSAATVGAITVATVPRSEVEEFKRLVGSEGRRKQGAAAESIPLGYGATFAMPAGCVLTWKTAANGAVRIEANKPPKLEWGPVNQSCEWAEIRADEIYLSLPYAPDVRIGIDGAAVSSAPRSPHWPAVRETHLKSHPVCEACGGSDEINVHHVIPFHDDPSKELDPGNLITLCRVHHWEIGHDPDGPDGPQRPNWSAANKNVRADSARMREKLNPLQKKVQHDLD